MQKSLTEKGSGLFLKGFGENSLFYPRFFEKRIEGYLIKFSVIFFLGFFAFNYFKREFRIINEHCFIIQVSLIFRNFRRSFSRISKECHDISFWISWSKTADKPIASRSNKEYLLLHYHHYVILCFWECSFNTVLVCMLTAACHRHF